MNAAFSAEHSKFDPPPQRGLLASFGLAVLVHLLLVLALTWGLRWKNQPQDMAVQAELWTPTVQLAAPPPPEPPPVPPTPTPIPKPVPAPPPPVVTEEDRDAEIALEQKKKREEQERKLAEERLKKEQAKKKAEAEAKEKAEQEAKRKEEADKKAAAEAKRKEEAEKKAEAEAKRKEEADKKAEKDKAAETARRAEALRRMAQMAGAGDGGGSAARASGPSGDYAGRIRAVVRPNIVFTDIVSGNPETEVEVLVDEKTGIITGRRITRSSGVKNWDTAVLRALDRTRKLPDDRGRYWNPMLMTFHPND